MRASEWYARVHAAWAGTSASVSCANTTDARDNESDTDAYSVETDANELDARAYQVETSAYEFDTRAHRLQRAQMS